MLPEIGIFHAFSSCPITGTVSHAGPFPFKGGRDFLPRGQNGPMGQIFTQWPPPHTCDACCH